MHTFVASRTFRKLGAAGLFRAILQCFLDQQMAWSRRFDQLLPVDLRIDVNVYFVTSTWVDLSARIAVSTTLAEDVTQQLHSIKRFVRSYALLALISLSMN